MTLPSRRTHDRSGMRDQTVMTRTTGRSTIRRRDRHARAREFKGASSMKNSKAIIAIVSIAFVLAIGAIAGRTASAAPTTVPLGTALGFSILAHTTVTNTGPTTVDKTLGIDAPPTSVSGFPPGVSAREIHAGDAVAGIAKGDLTNAYGNAASRGSTATYGDLTGLTLGGGVYALSSLTSDLGGNVTLNGQNDTSSVWIFQSPSTLITGSTSSVTLINGASA